MAKYLIKLKPLEPYFFGDENTFRIGEENRYYISSMLTPSASTILGTLRYELLKSKNLLVNGNNDAEKNFEREKLVGASSYKVGNDNTECTFGAIKSISPLFLMKGDEVLIKAPLSHKVGQDVEKCEKYTPMQFSGTKFATNHHDLELPKEGEFIAKKAVGEDWYMNLSTSDIYRGEISINEKSKPIFDKVLRVGIGRKEKDFFKKEYIMLHPKLCFGVTTDIECYIEDKTTDICYMGREKSPFVYTVEKTDISVETRIVDCLGKNNPKSFYYVFGDAFINGGEQNCFSVLRTGSIRMLSSETKNGKLSLSKGNSLYNTVQAGSVLYCEEMPTVIKCGGNFGFNSVIKIQSNQGGQE